MQKCVKYLIPLHKFLYVFFTQKVSKKVWIKSSPVKFMCTGDFTKQICFAENHDVSVYNIFISSCLMISFSRLEMADKSL